jgi:hypothetical protein
MPEADVDGAEPAGRKTCDRATRMGADRRQVGIDPRNDVAHEVLLPGSRPLAVVQGRQARRRSDGDEWADGARGDCIVGHGGELQPGGELPRRSAEALEEVQDRITRAGTHLRREVDDARTSQLWQRWISNAPLPHDPAGRAHADRHERLRQKRGKLSRSRRRRLQHERGDRRQPDKRSQTWTSCRICSGPTGHVRFIVPKPLLRDG